MEQLNNKVDGAGGAQGSLPAAEWNQIPSELQNIITQLGQSLSSGDLNQVGKAIAGYVANGDFYTDGGAADAYVLAVVGSKQRAPAYTDGFQIRFIAVNANTGASTVNVAGLGVKDIKLASGADPAAGDIDGRTTCVFDGGNDWFELQPSLFTGESTVTLVTASDAAWAYDADTKFAIIEATGAGGGAGSIDGQGAGTAAVATAGGGAETQNLIVVNPTGTLNITIPAGGTGGTSGGDGTDGGDTTVIGTGINIVAKGGLKGVGSVGTSGAIILFGSGKSPVGSGGDFSIAGSSSTGAQVTGGNRVSSSLSGHSPVWGGGAPSVNDTGGDDATQYGEGGGAPTSANNGTNHNGGDGFQGVVKITQFK